MVHKTQTKRVRLLPDQNVRMIVQVEDRPAIELASGAPGKAPNGETLVNHVYNHKTMAYEPQAQHSPLPWEHNATQPFTRYDGEREHGYACAIWTTKGEKPIATTNFSVGKWQALSPEIQDANAKLIVASVNNAEALAEALRELCLVVSPEKDSPALSPLFQYSKARAALAQWEGAK